MNDTTWFDLAPDHGVLELHEHLTSPGPALELHVVFDAAKGRTIAWWETDEGVPIRRAHAGSA
jgi:hypothetical protein